MIENLIIRLGSNAEDSIHWMVCSANNHSIIASGDITNASQLIQLTEKAKSRQVITLVPTSDVVLKSLNVPAKSQKAICLATPYMLEDELAQDVEQLFFAYSDIKDTSTDNNCFVAVVQRQQIKQWQSWLHDADISSKRMIPDVLFLPDATEQWQAIMLGNQVLLRQGSWQGALLDEQHWQYAMQTYQSLEGVSIEAHSLLPEYSGKVDNEERKESIESHSIEIKAMPEELPLAIFAQHIASQPFNLLQGEFQIKTARSPLVKTWAWAAGIAVFALLMNVGFKSVKLWQINDQQAAIEQQIIEKYKSTFPQTKRVRIATLRSQLKRKLAGIGSAANNTRFLTVLADIQPAFSQVPQLKPASIKFDSKRNELRMQATANDYQQFEKFKILLETQQFSVSQGAQNNQGDTISGSFSITPRKGDRS